VTLPTATFLDLEQWPRRAAFEFFRGFDIPCFNLCTRLDVSRLRRAVKEAGVGSMSLAYHFIAIRLANDIAPFRYRLQGDRVRVHELVHGSSAISPSFRCRVPQPSPMHVSAERRLSRTRTKLPPST
jgi:chloramphenicol O-acetyltransferase